ncbi:MAG: dienelactone hydrolase family protein, partial [Candidatus Eisenbacteria bacterium]
MIPLLCCLALVAGTPRAAGAAAASGIAAAAAPRSDTSRVHLGQPESGTAAFVAWPASRAAAPAVIVIHEWWGLNGQIRSVARRLAQEGYVAIVPDLYHGKVAGDLEYAHELSRGLDENKALGDLDATLGWLRAQSRVDRRRIGVVGFCMGGRLSELFALHSPELAAAVMFYGRPESDPGKLAALKVPLQGHFGREDRGIGADQVEALRSSLARAGKAGDIYVYPGAGHAFMHEGRPSYHADAARQAWARTLQ